MAQNILNLLFISNKNCIFLIFIVYKEGKLLYFFSLRISLFVFFDRFSRKNLEVSGKLSTFAADKHNSITKQTKF